MHPETDLPVMTHEADARHHTPHDRQPRARRDPRRRNPRELDQHHHGRAGIGQDDPRRGVRLRQRGRRAAADSLPHDALRAARQGDQVPSAVPVLRCGKDGAGRSVRGARRRAGGERRRRAASQAQERDQDDVAEDHRDRLLQGDPRPGEVDPGDAADAARGRRAPRGVQHDRPSRRRVPARGHRDVSRVRGGGRDHRAGEERLGTRDERYLRVFKLRGSSYRQGFHAFDIPPTGCRCIRVSSARSRRPPTSATSAVLRRASRARSHARGRLLDRERHAPRRSHRLRKDDDGHSIHRRGPPPRRTLPARQFPGEPHAARAPDGGDRRGTRRRRPRSLGAALLLGGRAVHRQDRRQHFPSASPGRDPPRGHRRARRPGHRRQRSHAHARLSLCAGAALRGDGREQHAHARDGPTHHGQRRESRSAEPHDGQHRLPRDPATRRDRRTDAPHREGAGHRPRSSGARAADRCQGTAHRRGDRA